MSETPEQTAWRRTAMISGSRKNTSRRIAKDIARSDAEAGMVLVPMALVAAFKETIDWASYETEYDRRMYDICQSCSGQDGKHNKNCKIKKYVAMIAAYERVDVPNIKDVTTKMMEAKRPK